MKKFVVGGLILVLIAVLWSAFVMVFNNAQWREYEFSREFVDRFDMSILSDDAVLTHIKNGNEYPVVLDADYAGIYRVWRVDLPQTERHHIKMSIIEMSADKKSQETECRILVTEHPEALVEQGADTGFFKSVENANVYCMASIVSLHGMVTVSTYGDTAEECIDYIETLLLETLADLVS